MDLHLHLYIYTESVYSTEVLSRKIVEMMDLISVSDFFLMGPINN